MARAIITAPKTAKRGEVIEIRALIGHPMETGLRVDSVGQQVPADLIRRFTCHWGNELVFSAELYAAIAANPYVAFHVLATASATLRLNWAGDKGFNQTETITIEVT